MTPGRQCHPCPPGPTLLPALNFQLLGMGSSSQSLGSNSSQGWEAGECSALRISPAHTLPGCQSCSELAAKATAWSLWGGFGVQPLGNSPSRGSPCAPTGKGGMAAVCAPLPRQAALEGAPPPAGPPRHTSQRERAVPSPISGKKGWPARGNHQDASKNTSPRLS